MEVQASPLAVVVQRIAEAAQRSKRDANSVQLVAVTKTVPVDVMQSFSRDAGTYNVKVIFGENYVQEARQKKVTLDAEKVSYAELHLQGPLQSNKVKDAVRTFDVIQSVHSLKVLRLIAQEAARLGKQQHIFLQVNISDDPAKSGFREGEIDNVVREVASLKEHIALEGLMTITAFHDNPEDNRGDFKRMALLRKRLSDEGLHAAFVDGCIKLSMGMSADFAVAIEEGADLVRVGTALFGDRV
jgi:pyridoxal phosphate enzyme (YggS family)